MPAKLVYTNHYTHNNKVKLVKGGADYFNLLCRLIADAQSAIYVRAYIFNDDDTGKLVAKALMNAAKRNVAVYILADGYASQWLSNKFLHQLKEAGINFRYFEPLWRSTHFYFGRRMHEKVFVADGYYALVGGVNIADRYNNIHNHIPWLDYAVYVEGEAATALQMVCAEAWGNKKVDRQLPHKNLHITIEAENNCSVRLRRNDWVKGKHEIWKSYFNFFNIANKSITIICSYFLPGRVLRKRMSLAVKRGVRIKIILAGPSDVMLAKYAERYLYSWMLQNKIELYEYQPIVLHAKMMVVDSHWVTIGSYNVNNISAYASIEFNFDIRNRPFAQGVQQELDTIIARDCVQITSKNFSTNANIFKQFLQKTSYEIIRLILNLFTFYFKHE